MLEDESAQGLYNVTPCFSAHNSSFHCLLDNARECAFVRDLKIQMPVSRQSVGRWDGGDIGLCRIRKYNQ